eukprot:350973-Chlamydomonas_euryale.AAC.2
MEARGVEAAQRFSTHVSRGAGTSTRPHNRTLPTSLRPRSTSMTCSAHSCGGRRVCGDLHTLAARRKQLETLGSKCWSSRTGRQRGAPTVLVVADGTATGCPYSVGRRGRDGNGVPLQCWSSRTGRQRGAPTVSALTSLCACRPSTHPHSPNHPHSCPPNLPHLFVCQKVRLQRRVLLRRRAAAARAGERAVGDRSVAVHTTQNLGAAGDECARAALHVHLMKRGGWARWWWGGSANTTSHGTI